MTVDTWVSTGVLLGTLIALFTYLSSIARGLRGDITGLRTEVKSDIAELRTEVKSDIAELRTEVRTDIAELRTEVRADIRKLDERVYALATGRTTQPLIIPPKR